MIDLSGQVVSVTLNPAQVGCEYANGVLTFTDIAGTQHAVACPIPVQQPNDTWATCFPRTCDR